MIDLSGEDVKLLDIIQSNCRTTISELAEQINVSETPCWRRWKKLEKDGVIKGYQAVLDRKKIGISIIGFSQISLNSHYLEDTDRFEEAIRNFNWVTMCFCITGNADFIIQIVARDLDEYYEKVSKIRRIKTVSSIQSSIAIKEIKASNNLPLK